MSVPEFPFQFLPSITREKVVQVMGGQDRLSFSTISEDANKLSKPHKQQTKLVTIELDGNMTLKTYLDDFPNLTIRLGGDNFTPLRVYSEWWYINGVEQDDKIRKDLKRSKYSLRDWIDHFMGLVKCEAVNLRLGGQERDTWNPATLLKVLQGLNVEQIDLCGQVGEKGIRVVQQCPTVKRAYFGDYFPTGNERVELLSREFDEFSTTCSRHTKLALHEILRLRSKVVMMMSTRLDKHSLNSLLKEWENGWNPNFEAMIFKCLANIGNIPDILNGIDYHEVVDDDQGVHRFMAGPALLWGSDKWREKAYQIQRKETGVKANLNFSPISPRSLVVKLIVQH